MPIVPIAGSRKSQIVSAERRPGDVVIDFTLLWAALTGATRGEDGRFPVREDDDPSLPLVSAAYWFTLSEAVRRELSGFVTSASRANVERLERVTGRRARVVDVKPGPLLARLSEVDDGGGTHLNKQCVVAARRWWTNAAEVKWHARGVGSWKGPDGQTDAPRARTAAAAWEATMMSEVRCAVEIREDESRQSPGRIVGTILETGRVASDRREVFAPGSVQFPANGLRSALPRRRRHAPYDRGRPAPSRRRDRLLRRPSHLGSDARPSSAPALRHPGWGARQRRQRLGRLPPRVLPPGPGPLSLLPPGAPRGAARRLQVRTTPLRRPTGAPQ